MPAKKYKLFSQSSDSNEKPICAFFTSPGGCRNGENCKFLHSSSEGGVCKAAPNSHVKEVSDSSSVVSSESEGEITMDVEEVKKSNNKDNKKAEQKTTQASAKNSSRNDQKVVKAQQQKKGKRKSVGNADPQDPFAKPKKQSGPIQDRTDHPNKRQKQSKQQTPSKKNSPKPTPNKVKSSSGGSDFRSLMQNLPIASFSIPGHENSVADEKPESNVSEADDASPDVTNSSSTTQDEEDELPCPKSNELGRKWLKTVKKSQGHQRYKSFFDFAKNKENDKEAGIPSEWIKCKPYGEWCESNPQAIAIDCEMCETQDPLTGSKNPKALCRVSIVNADKPEEVLLDTLVKPVWPVTDYRTKINGISKENLDSVEFTLRHAQAFMMALCSDETVIVGHAVHNDLVALNMEHYCVADSTFLFRAKDSSSASVSLKDLVQAIFQKKMPETHDSVNDARKAMECVLHYMEKDGKVDPIERTPRNNGHQLFVHRIPKQCKAQHLLSMFLNHTYIQPKDVEDLEFSGSTGKAYVTFRSSRHASLAFDTLDGAAEEDKGGRLQKKVYLRNGDYVRVRKMTYQYNNSGTPNKRNTPNKKDKQDDK